MNKATNLIESIQTLLEAQYNGSYYLVTSEDFSDNTIEAKEWKAVGDGGLGQTQYELSNGEKILVGPLVFTANGLYNYRRNVARGNSSYTTNTCIYKLQGPLKLLDTHNKRELRDLISKTILHSESSEYQNCKTIEEKVDYFYNLPDCRFPDCIHDYESFINKYRGFWGYGSRSSGKRVIVLVPMNKISEFLSSLPIVDGNLVRFKTGVSGQETNDLFQSIPDEVLEDIHKYTFNFSHKFKDSTREWLLQNLKKPYSSKTLYRGIGIVLDPYGNNAMERAKQTVNNYLKKLLGLSDLNELLIGQKVLAGRGDRLESSWTTNPQIARSFSSGEAIKDINILLKAEVPAEQVFFDFNLLPRIYLKRKFKYWLENEVIVEGVVPAVVTGLWIGKEDKYGNKKEFVQKFLQETGYTFKNNVGFLKT